VIVVEGDTKAFDWGVATFASRAAVVAYVIVTAAVVVGVLAAVGSATAFSIATAATPHQGSIPTALKKGPAQVGNWTGGEADNADVAGILADTHTEWSAATNGSQSAAALEVSSGTSVMPAGGAPAMLASF